jgi:FKBP-type peptidyl-prolyl cis-trans isomerase
MNRSASVSTRRFRGAALALALATPLALFTGCDSKKPKGGGLTTSSATSAGTKKSGSDVISLGPQGPACEEWQARPQFADVPAPTDVAAAPPDALSAPSGVAYKIVAATEAPTPAPTGDASAHAPKADAGATPALSTMHPGAQDTVLIKYTVWTKAGTPVIDASGAVPMNAPEAALSQNLLAKSVLEAVALLSPGQRARMWVPAAKAFGETTRKDAPCGALTYEVELGQIFRTPEDLKTPPSTKTPGGIALKVLTKGTGPAPKPNDSVTFHMTTWIAAPGENEGRLMDQLSTTLKGRPETAQLAQLPKGLQEPLAQMKVGDKVRVWTSFDVFTGQPTREILPIVAELELLAAHQ